MRPLAGFDDRGRVYDAGGTIVRTVHAPFRERALALFRRYEAEGLSSLGVIETRLADSEELAFVHPKLTISYPFEWPANMLKDAALFHLDLLAGLERRGLTLKDALPGNILFDGPRPRFIDFFSLVPTSELPFEEWLYEGGAKGSAWQLVLQKMFFPYFLVPLMVMTMRDYSRARRLLAEKACNCAAENPSGRDLLGIHPRQLRAFLRYRQCKRGIERRSPSEAIAELRRFVESLEVTPPQGGYVDYYAEKKEAFALDNAEEWKPKQRSVQAVLSRVSPRTVLDIGANTGWFSRLAEREGAHVIAVDSDESAIDHLYTASKTSGTKILPLQLSFSDFTRIVACQAPLFLPAIERLQADVVLCLGLLHHLILGENRTMDSVLEMLFRLSHESVVLEFVSFEDELVRRNPGFFPHIAEHSPATYNLETLLDAARRHFRRVSTLESHPQTRTLVVLER